MSTDVKNIEESFNVPKIIPEYENEVRHPFFDPYRAEIADFSRVRSLMLTLYQCSFTHNHMNHTHTFVS